MDTGLLAPPARFVGRDEYIARFKARVEHFNFFIYEGNPGTGKTALMLRLLKETRPVGLTTSLYLPLWPGETIHSVLGRVEARFRRGGGSSERQGDPFARLIDLLVTHKTALVLDAFHNLRREDRPVLARAVRARVGRYRVLAACRTDPELSAMDRAALFLERLGPLTVAEVEQIAGQFKIKGKALERLLEDARRGGATLQPLTLIYMLSLCGNDLPSEQFLQAQTARSSAAFRALMGEIGDRLGNAERVAMQGLKQVGLPIAKTVAVRAFGAVVDRLLKARLIDEIDKEVYLHHNVAQWLESGPTLSVSAAKTVARHLEQQALARGEPMYVTRAGELLAHAKQYEDAIETLASGWEAVRDLGFMEAYLKTLSGIEIEGALQPRARLLSARARMRQGNPSLVKPEMEGLAKERDKWTRARALVALTYIYSYELSWKAVVHAYEELDKLTTDSALLIPAGIAAAGAMVRLGRIADAEKLAKVLLGKLKGQKAPSREGELHRLLARVHAQAGRLDVAVKEGHAAAKAFEQAGDLYHAATAYGFVGDLYRETGDFELAKEVFGKFHALATAWGDRDLIQIAELADAWVSLDIGDMTHAAQQIAAVERELSAVPSRRLRRYLAAARALLDAGRGRHKEAASALRRVVEAWEGAGQRAIADILRAQLVRSLIASGDLDQADQIVRKALSRLDAETAAPRVATFLRESALIRLRRKDVQKAMEELSQARKLFAKGGNRREEALTLHRIAHAALEEGDVDLAAERAKEALALAKSIKHQRAIALARELMGRVALAHGDPVAATASLREAASALRRLGDEVGTLHVSEWLLRAQIFAGDLASVIRQGPKVRQQAERLGVDEIRIRALALTGAALLRRNRMDAASRCFSELGPSDANPLTLAINWRLGEAIAVVQGDRALALQRRARWVAAVRSLPEHRQPRALRTIEQLNLPPSDRSRLRTHEGERMVGAEEIAWLDPTRFDLFVDVHDGRVVTAGEEVTIPDPDMGALLVTLVNRVPPSRNGHVVGWETLYHDMVGRPPEDKPDRPFRPVAKELKRVLRKARDLDVVVEDRGIRFQLPPTYAFVVPAYLIEPELSPQQREIVKLLGRLGTVPLPTVQDELEIPRGTARREINELIKKRLVEAVRDGRGQAFRLA